MKNKRLEMHVISLTAVLVAILWVIAPTPIMADETGAPPGDYARGVKLWGDNCARCHNMRDPKEFRDDQWKVGAMHMRIRAGFTGQDTRDMLKFLQDSN